MRFGQTQSSNAHHSEDFLDLHHSEVGTCGKHLLGVAQQITNVKDVLCLQAIGCATGQSQHFDWLDCELLLLGQRRPSRLPDGLLRNGCGKRSFKFLELCLAQLDLVTQGCDLVLQVYFWDRFHDGCPW